MRRTGPPPRAERVAPTMPSRSVARRAHRCDARSAAARPASNTPSDHVGTGRGGGYARVCTGPRPRFSSSIRRNHGATGDVTLDSLAFWGSFDSSTRFHEEKSDVRASVPVRARAVGRGNRPAHRKRLRHRKQLWGPRIRRDAATAVAAAALPATACAAAILPTTERAAVDATAIAIATTAVATAAVSRAAASTTTLARSTRTLTSSSVTTRTFNIMRLQRRPSVYGYTDYQT